MDKACEAVLSHKLSVRLAAEEYGVPRSTLNDKVSGKVPVQAKSGRKAYLTDEEEDRLVEFLVGCASVGYANHAEMCWQLHSRFLMPATLIVMWS